MEDEGMVTVTFQVGGPGTEVSNNIVATGGGFGRAARLTTDQTQEVTLADDGGSEFLIGTTNDFLGSGIAIDATGNAVVKLK